MVFCKCKIYILPFAMTVGSNIYQVFILAIICTSGADPGVEENR